MTSVEPNTDELSVRRFGGNGNVLCDFKCPFNSAIAGEGVAFCHLFRKRLDLWETGNNDLCDRCEECLAR